MPPAHEASKLTYFGDGPFILSFIKSGLFLPKPLHNSQRKPERQAFLFRTAGGRAEGRLVGPLEGTWTVMANEIRDQCRAATVSLATFGNNT